MRAPERPFDAPWQALAFAMTLAMHEAGAFAWSDWSATLARHVGEAPYWEAWLGALEEITGEGEALRALFAAWRAAADAAPHGQPVVLPR